MLDRAQLITRLKSVKAETQRRSHLDAPDEWLYATTGEPVWTKQKQIMLSVARHRKTAVRSCHQSGKSFTAARIAAWWIMTHPPGTAFVVTTAPTGRQVRAILWREIRRAHRRGNMPGRLNQTEWYLNIDGDEQLVAFGQKPSDIDPTAFQGIHERFVLVILDEACGIAKALWEAADSLIANDESRILAIGNPDDPSTEFEVVCKPGSGWNVIGISAFDTPNFTQEVLLSNAKMYLIGKTWVEEKRKKWAPRWTWNHGNTACVPPPGETDDSVNPLWASKVLGKFPTGGVGSQNLIQVTWIERAQEQDLMIPEFGVSELGVDCGMGGDASVTAWRKGKVVRVLSEDHNPDTMQTCGKVVEEMKYTKATAVKVDATGIGAGIADRGREQGFPFIPIIVGQSAICICHELREQGALKRPGFTHYDDCNVSRFANLRAQNWWTVREMFEAGDIDIDPTDDDLAAELATIRWKRNSRGQIQIESKDDARKRGIRSPNRADAVMHAMTDAPNRAIEEAEPERKAGLLW